MNVAIFAEQPISVWFKYLLDPYNLPINVRERWQDMMLAVGITLDALWYARKKIVREAHQLEMTDILHYIQTRFAAHKAAWNSTDSMTIISWRHLRGQLV